jgi:hypothetical protein
MGRALDYVDTYLDEARDRVDEAMREVKLSGAERELTRADARLRALEHVVRWLAGEVDRLEAQ